MSPATMSPTGLPKPQLIAQLIIVKGIVQGVGFRPFVYRIAHLNKITGDVTNTSAGVKIHAAGTVDDVKNFVNQLSVAAPPLAVIDSIEIKPVTMSPSRGFTISNSEKTATKEVILPPDVTICSDCEKELFDPGDRRYQYFLNNCTNCGPRYTIIDALPYDRPTTAMAPFPLCVACQKEYTDPGNRRFHAEATSCPRCGPKLKLYSSDGRVIDTATPIKLVADKIEAGNIVAIQGVGGFHIVCDALNSEAIHTLRQRKRRLKKPFAVMVKDSAMAHKYGILNEHSRTLIDSIQRPVVIVPDRKKCSPLVTCGVNRIGLLLPYTPLHLLLFQFLCNPIVATSANISDEPIITDSAVLLQRLGSVVDYILEFNRDIVNGCDDSVVALAGSIPMIIRRARGYAPASVKLPASLDRNILAVGAGLKNTIAIGKQDQAIISPHIGDLHTLSAENYFARAIATFYRLYDFKPELIVHDKHPGYASTRWAKRQNIACCAIQHHYAHTLSGMVACGMGMETEILSICWDGSGYGDDGTIWGGEFLQSSFKNYNRIAHLKPFRLLGGDKAILEPRRVALSLLFDLYGEDALQLKTEAVQLLTPVERKNLYQMYQKNLNSPLTSSIGRLFDAAASLLGICQILSYEGESGLLMEKYYDSSAAICYPFAINDGKIDCSAAITQMLFETDRVKGVTGFMNMLVQIIVAVMHSTGHREALLCGGVFQNSRLVEKLLATAEKTKIKFHLPGNVPVNDGGISLGQIAFALSQSQSRGNMN